MELTYFLSLSLSTLPVQPLPSLCAAEQYHSCRDRTLLVAASTRPPLLTVIPLMPIVWTRPSTGTPNLTRSSGLPSIQVLTGVHHCFVLRPTPRVFPDSLTSPRMPISTTALVSHCCAYAKHAARQTTPSAFAAGLLELLFLSRSPQFHPRNSCKFTNY